MVRSTIEALPGGHLAQKVAVRVQQLSLGIAEAKHLEYDQIGQLYAQVGAVLIFACGDQAILADDNKTSLLACTLQQVVFFHDLPMVRVTAQALEKVAANKNGLIATPAPQSVKPGEPAVDPQQGM